MPSFMLIHPTVLDTIYTNVTDRTDRQTDRQDNGSVAQGEPFYKRSPTNWSRNSYHALFRGVLSSLTWTSKMLMSVSVTKI